MLIYIFSALITWYIFKTLINYINTHNLDDGTNQWGEFD